MDQSVQFEAVGTFYEPATAEPGWERFAQDIQREINLDDYYLPYPMQQAFHASPAKHRLLGGAAGPGKTLALIVEHLITCNEFTNPKEAVQVHTLILRRTNPQLLGSVIQRFQEKVPRELYSHYHETDKTVTWLNGATTKFGSMQYETDYLNYQGSQWKDIDFDELTQFTFKQWVGISAWNRCPVARARKGGATNPIGIGAGWVKALFHDHKPCPEMDANQRAEYKPNDYSYFPCTYRDNPIYANSPDFLDSLKSYTAPERKALMDGIWGAFGTYFDIWDPAVHVYAADSVKIEPWWSKWVSGDWGFHHWAAFYWHCLDPLGIVRTYRELVVNKQSPGKLAETVASHCYDENGNLEKYEPYLYLSHDAFHEKQDTNTVALQMTPGLKGVGLVPINAGKDKVGRERLMYSMLEESVKLAEVFNEATGEAEPVLVPRWQVTDAPNCGDQYAPRLVDVIARAPHDEDKPEQIAEFEGDDPIAGAGHGIYGKFSGRLKKPAEQQILERVTSADPTIRTIQYMKAVDDYNKGKRGNVTVVLPRRWRPRPH